MPKMKKAYCVAFILMVIVPAFSADILVPQPRPRADQVITLKMKRSDAAIILDGVGRITLADANRAGITNLYTELMAQYSAQISDQEPVKKQ
jgi:opacity protein-like surface antigen